MSTEKPIKRVVKQTDNAGSFTLVDKDGKLLHADEVEHIQTDEENKSHESDGLDDRTTEKA